MQMKIKARHEEMRMRGLLMNCVAILVVILTLLQPLLEAPNSTLRNCMLHG